MMRVANPKAWEAVRGLLQVSKPLRMIEQADRLFPQSKDHLIRVDARIEAECPVALFEQLFRP